MPQKDIEFYTVTKDAWNAMLADLYAAEKSIDIEQYIFTHDTAGDRFIDVLIQKARQGLSIRLLLDAAGSFSISNSTLVSELRDMGIQIKFFNPIKPWLLNLTSNFFRDHRKLLIIDGMVGHLGGVGIQEKMELWRDTHMRLTGPLVPDIFHSFETMWQGMRRWEFLRFKKPQHFVETFVKKYNLLTNAPLFRQRFIYQALIDTIRNARKYIYLTTPYFIPDPRLFRVLRLAVQRGVEVRLLVPEIADHLFIDHAREYYFDGALRAGIKIYLYQNVMMHAKAAVIDDVWATSGSFNLDSLSLFFNYEANISSEDPEFISALKTHFFADLQNSKEVTYAEWRKRPLSKKILELLTWPFHRIM